MADLARFGVSLDKDLLDRFDERIKEDSFQTRSKAISSLITEYVAEGNWGAGGMVAGAITILYDHHGRDTVAKLLDLQHEAHDIIISIQHIHLDHDNCLEILAFRGKASEVEPLYRKLKALKGIKQASVSVADVADHPHHHHHP